MEIFSNDDKIYIIRGPWTSVCYGCAVENNSLMCLNPVYDSYGELGYFFEKQGGIYYFDDFHCDMSGDDSLNCLYERIDDLPANWELTPKDRLGEKGVINKKTAYVINEIEDIVLNDNPLFCGKIIFKMKNVLGTDPEYVDYIVFDQSSKEKFNFFKNDSLNIAKIIGKPLKFFFTLDDHVPFAYWEDYTVESWKNGFVDGWINMDEEAVRRCIPHDIREINTIGPSVTQ